MLTEGLANNFIHFGTLAKHNNLHTKTYVAMLSTLVKEFENRFQDYHKIISVSVCLQCV